MFVKKIKPYGFAANCFVVYKEAQEALVIDPSTNKIVDRLKEMGVQAKDVLLTHCHFDHTVGVPAMQSSGAKIWCGEKEKALLGTADLYDMAGVPFVPFAIDGTLLDGEEKYLCGLKVTVIHTPGHTLGSVCYLIEDEGQKALFTGDTLFCGTIGRTDFPTGNIGQMRQSLRKLKNLEGDMPVYAGHEEDTTLEAERNGNFYLRDA